MTQLYLMLDTDSYVTITREADSSDRWDRDDTHTSWSINGVKLLDHDAYKALSCDADFKVGDKVYVVYAVYSTGDSFGHDEGRDIEFVSWHRDEEIAKQNVQSLIQGNTKGYHYTIKLDNGSEITRYCPWDGYFESLDYAEYREFIIE